MWLSAASRRAARTSLYRPFAKTQGGIAFGSFHRTRLALESFGEVSPSPIKTKGVNVKRFVLAIALVGFTVPAPAATCMAEAKDKKLAGAAEKSFLKKCEADAKAACDTQAKDKKLSGAAQTSFVKKCVADAVGS